MFSLLSSMIKKSQNYSLLQIPFQQVFPPIRSYMLLTDLAYNKRILSSTDNISGMVLRLRRVSSIRISLLQASFSFIRQWS